MTTADIGCIIGKTINGVIVKTGEAPPRMQLFLLFDDETYYELYSDYTFSCAGGLDKGGVEEVLSYMSEGKRVIFSSFEE